jgi:hypothetical protein
MGKMAVGEKAMNEDFFGLCVHVNKGKIKITGEVVSALKAVIHKTQLASYSSQLGVCFNVPKYV